MKILATIPQKHSQPEFIIQASAAELSALLLMQSVYSTVSVIAASGSVEKRDVKDLLPGDEIEQIATREIQEQVNQFLGARKEVEMATSTLRGALTKLGNAFQV